MRATFKWLISSPKAVVKSLVAPLDMKLKNRKVAIRELSEQPFRELENDQLDQLIQSEWQRAKEIDEKLFKLTTALSISVAVAGLAGTTLLQTLSHSNMKYPIAIIFLISSFQFIVGVYIGFSGALPKPRYGYGAGYLSKISGGDESARLERISAASAFERDNIIRSNEATAATISIRNGVLALALALFASLLTAIMDSPRDNAPEGEKLFLVFNVEHNEGSFSYNSGQIPCNLKLFEGPYRADTGHPLRRS